MPTFEVTSPDGRTFEIDAPDGATHADALAYAQSHHAATSEPEKPSLTAAFAKGAYSPFKPIVDNSLEALKSAATSTGEAISEPLNAPGVSGAMAIPDAAVRTLGKVGNVIGGAGSAAFSPITGALTASAESALPYEAKLLGATDQTMPTPEQMHQIAQEQGGIMAGGVGAAMGANLPIARERAGLAPVVRPENPAVFSKVADAVKPLIEDETSGVSMRKATLGALPNESKPSISSLAQTYDPLKTHDAISESYGAAKKQAGKYYDFTKEVGNGKVIPSGGLKSGLDEIISDIKNSPFHEGSSALPKLEAIQKKLVGGGESPGILDQYGNPMKSAIPDTVEVNDLVDLKQLLNNNFNPKRFVQAKDTPYGKISNIVDTSLDDAAKIYPDFGEAKSLADKNWMNTVSMPFQNNKVLQKFWKPEDYFAKKGVANGIAEELPDATKQRAMSMLKGIKDPVQLDAVRRVLPKDIADSLSAAKIQDVTKGRAASRVTAAGKTAYNAATLHLPTALRSAADVINPGYTPEQLLLLKTAKSAPPMLSDKYIEPFQNLKNRIGIENSYAKGGVVKENPHQIDAIISAASAKGNDVVRSNIGDVSPWLSDRAKISGMNLAGFKHTIDNFSIRHLRNEHGDPIREKSRGQIALTDDDFRNIPAIISQPDKVVFGTQNRQGKPQIGYLKKLPDGSTMYLEEVRTGKKELAAHSMRKYSATTNESSILKSLNPNARNDSGKLIIHDATKKSSKPIHMDFSNKPDGYSIGGSVKKKNLTAEFLARTRKKA